MHPSSALPANPFGAASRAFISYARSDGEGLATSLRERLQREHPEIQLWQDRLELEGGIGWWKQITDAIDQVEFLIMVVTPGAVRSEVARKEWRYARQQGVRICPVMMTGPELVIDFGALPSWMRKVHFYDLDREWSTFVGFLRGARRDARVPFMAPDVREDFIERPEEFDALLSSLLDSERSSPVAITTALQGAGGFGKTTLAVALCHHEAVLSAFDDGILWATLGQEPKLQVELTKLYAALTGERPAFIDVDDAAMHLAERLEDRNCLLVIDDVWDPHHVKPFLRGGRACARLITTRVTQVTVEVAAARVVVNEMTTQQSVQLLSARLQPAVGQELHLVHELAQRLGEWPLLLRLAASQLRERTLRGASLEDAVGHVDQALRRRGVEAFDRANPSERHDAVASTVGASLTVLDAADRQRGIELAIFPRGLSIPFGAVSSLWQLDSFETEELVQRLDNVALLDFDLRTATVRLHDVVQSYLHELLEDSGQVHARLTRQGWPDPYRLPDKYAWRWIGWHLARAGEHARLQQLLSDYAWLKAKLEATDVQAVLDEFELVNEDTLRPLRDALRLASHGLTRDVEQLAAQLIGRLAPGSSELVDRVLADARASVKGAWLGLLERSLTSPGGALLAIMKGHAGPVAGVCLTPEGTHAVSASGDGTLRVWELSSGRVIRVLEGHRGPVHCVAITGSGRQVISGAEDRAVDVWDVESGQCERILRGHYGPVYGVAVDPGGERVFSVSEDGRVCCAGANSKQIQLFKLGSLQLRPVVLSPDGALLLFASEDWTAVVLDLGSGQTLTTLRGHEGAVRALAFSPDGRRVVSGAEDATLRVWDRASGETLRILQGHQGAVNAVAVTPDGRRVLSGGRDRSLRIWDLESGETLSVLEGHSGPVLGLALNSSGSHAVSASADRTLRYWRTDGPTPRQLEKAHLSPVGLVAVAVDGRRAISGAQHEDLRVWDLEQRRVERVLEPPRSLEAAATGPVLQLVTEQQRRLGWLSLTPDGSRAIATYSDRRLCIWDVQSGSLVREIRGGVDGRQLAISRDATRAVSLLRDATVRVTDLASGRTLRLLASSENERALENLPAPSALLSELELELVVDVAPVPIRREGRVALSPSGSLVVLGFHSSLVLWDVLSGVVRAENIGDFDVATLVVDADARFAFIGSRFGPVRVVDLALAKTVLVLEGHRGAILDLALSEDGRRLFSAGRDDTLRAWDLASGKQLSSLGVRAGKVDEVALSRKADLAYSISGDTLIVCSLRGMTRLSSLSIDHQISSLSMTEDGRKLVLGDESGRVHFLQLEL
jgi:WD40 repeat protein